MVPIHDTILCQLKDSVEYDRNSSSSNGRNLNLFPDPVASVLSQGSWTSIERRCIHFRIRFLGECVRSVGSHTRIHKPDFAPETTSAVFVVSTDGVAVSSVFESCLRC